jgi:two-component system NtrC family sensor kinase
MKKRLKEMIGEKWTLLLFPIKVVLRRINPLLRQDLHSRLIVGFMIAVFLPGLIATLIGIWTINKSTIDEVQSRVRQDINTAKLIYNNTLEQIVSQLRFSAENDDLLEAVRYNKREKLESLRGQIRHVQVISTPGDPYFLDMLSVVSADGKVLFRAGNPTLSGDEMLWDPVVRRCIDTKTPQASTELMPIQKILAENPSLAERVHIDIVKTPRSFEVQEKQLQEGMVLRAAYPIVDKNRRLLGVLTGGTLLSRERVIVDKIRETVYHDEKYKGRQIGVATIFQGGVRIATNVMTRENQRAIGTTLAKDVYDHVILKGMDWVGRAFVVNDWYITTYTPLYNIDRKLIGILYTGILDAKYRDMMWKLIWINMGIASLGMILAIIISLRMGNTIIRRIRILKKAAEAIAAGNLNYQLSPDTISGFDILDEAFNNMSRSLKDRDERLKKLHEQLTRSEKLTALGEMAAGVAHEINNPLGGILLYGNLVLEDLPGEGTARSNMIKIIHQTNRCKNIVQGLLDFARTPTGEMQPLQINDAVRAALELVRDQSIFHGITVETHFAENLPDVNGDTSRLEEVFLNLFINAADAMKEKGGKLTIVTSLKDGKIWLSISDTGKGIDRDHLPHIFEPFFTTKEPGHGTGLGLSIAYGVIKRHRGSIEADSAPGKGTQFVISLPPLRATVNDLTAKGTDSGRPTAGLEQS